MIGWMFKRFVGALGGVMAVVCCALCTGCVSLRTPELAEVRYEIEDAFPGTEFKKDTEISVGPVMMAMIRAGARFAPDSEEWRPFISGARRVQVAVYHARSLPKETHRNLDMPARLSEMLNVEGWELVFKSREKDEVTWVLYRLKHNKVRNVYVVALDKRELTLVNVEGDITKVILAGIQEHGEWY